MLHALFSHAIDICMPHACYIFSMRAHLGHFPDEFAGTGQRSGVEAIETLELVEQRHIVNVLDSCNGNRAEAARRLGVSRKTIDRKCSSWDV